jgi:hypothetical protein
VHRSVHIRLLLIRTAVLVLISVAGLVAAIALGPAMTGEHSTASIASNPFGGGSSGGGGASGGW